MSWQAVTWVLEKSRSELGTRLVLISIASHANRLGEESWPAIETIAQETRLSIRQVYRCEYEAKDIGELVVVSTPGKRNSYSLPRVKKWLENLDLTPDVDVTPDNMSPLTSCHGTPDTHVTPPLTSTTQKRNVSLTEPSLTVLNRPGGKGNTKSPAPGGYGKQKAKGENRDGFSATSELAKSNRRAVDEAIARLSKKVRS